MVVDEMGSIIETKMRGKRLMPDKDIETYTGLWTVFIRGICRQMEKFLGTHQFYSLAFDKLIVYGLASTKNTIVITARNDLPLETVLKLKETARAP
jgi:hypothetical protein